MAVPNLTDGDILQVIHNYEVDGQTCINVFHYKVQSAPSIPVGTYYDQMSLIADDFAVNPAGIIQKWVAMATADCVSRYVQVQRLQPQRNLYVSVNTGDAGALAGVSAPSICALSISRRTEATGRGKTGHVQLSGMPAADLVHGEWDAASVNRADDFAVAMLSTVTFGAGGQLVPGLFGELNTPKFAPLVAATVRTTVRTMHRRTVGLGI